LRTRIPGGCTISDVHTRSAPSESPSPSDAARRGAGARRITIRQERGVDVNSLPRVDQIKEPFSDPLGTVKSPEERIVENAEEEGE